MRKKLKISIPIITTLILSLFSIPVFAQSQDVVTSEVDHHEITTDEKNSCVLTRGRSNALAKIV